MVVGAEFQRAEPCICTYFSDWDRVERAKSDRYSVHVPVTRRVYCSHTSSKTKSFLFDTASGTIAPHVVLP